MKAGAGAGDVVVIPVFRVGGRWLVDFLGSGHDSRVISSRRQAVEVALDLAANVVPAVVLLFTAEGRLRRSIPVGAVPPELQTVGADRLHHLCCREPGLQGGSDRCWKRPRYRMPSGERLCAEHALGLVGPQGLEALHADDRARFLAENPGYGLGTLADAG